MIPGGVFIGKLPGQGPWSRSSGKLNRPISNPFLDASSLKQDINLPRFGSGWGITKVIPFIALLLTGCHQPKQNVSNKGDFITLHTASLPISNASDTSQTAVPLPVGKPENNTLPAGNNVFITGDVIEIDPPPPNPEPKWNIPPDSIHYLSPAILKGKHPDFLNQLLGRSYQDVRLPTEKNYLPLRKQSFQLLNKAFVAVPAVLPDAIKKHIPHETFYSRPGWAYGIFYQVDPLSVLILPGLQLSDDASETIAIGTQVPPQ